VAVLATLLPGCWLQVGFDNGHTRHNDAEEVLTLATAGSVTERWAVDLSAGTAEPMVRGDRVYVTTGGFDAATDQWSIGARAIEVDGGSEAWRRTFVSFCCNTPVVDFATPTFVNNQMWTSYLLIYSVGTRPFGGFGGPARLDPVGGGLLGREDFTTVSPAIEADGRVVQAVADTALAFSLRVRDAETLALLWTGDLVTSQLSGPIAAPTAVADGRIVVAEPTGLTAFPLAGCGQPTCAPTWHRDLGDAVRSVVIPAGGDVLALAGDRLLALSPTTGDTLWTADLGIEAPGLAVTGDTIYVGAAATLRAYGAGGCGGATCEPVWTAPLGTSATSSPTVAGGAVYVGGTGVIEVFDADGCGAVDGGSDGGGEGGPANCPAAAAIPLAGTVAHVVVAQGHLFAVSRPGGSPSRLTAFAPAP
jgi:outer membrane protein assembly factor BamB